MEKFNDLNTLLDSIKGVVKNEETLIDANVPFVINILEKQYVALFKEDDNFSEILSIIIEDQENNDKFQLDISYEDLSKHEDNMIKKIYNFFSESIGLTLDINDKNAFMLRNKLTLHPTTISRDLHLTCYIPHANCFERVRRVKLKQKNITIDEEKNVIIRDENNTYSYQLNDDEAKFMEFIKTA